MMHKNMTLAEILAEYRKGCSNTVAAKVGPEECPVCVAGFVHALDALNERQSALVAGQQPYPAMPEPDVIHPAEQEDSFSRSALEAAMRAAHDRGYSVGWDHGKGHASAPVAGEARPAIILKALDEYGPQLDWTKHWAEYPIGTKFYAGPKPKKDV